MGQPIINPHKVVADFELRSFFLVSNATFGIYSGFGGIQLTVAGDAEIQGETPLGNFLSLGTGVSLNYIIDPATADPGNVKIEVAGVFVRGDIVLNPALWGAMPSVHDVIPMPEVAYQTMMRLGDDTGIHYPSIAVPEPPFSAFVRIKRLKTDPEDTYPGAVQIRGVWADYYV
jgi:hypothetical protein